MRRALIVCLLVCVCAAEQTLDLPEGHRCFEEGRPGVCVRLSQCLTAVLVDVQENHRHPLLCSFDGDTPIVCCTGCDKTTHVKDVRVTPNGLLYKSGQRAWDRCVDYIATLPYKCSATNVNMSKKWDDFEKCFRLDEIKEEPLSGGSDAERGQFPHMALLGYGEDRDTADWHCAGSVISERYILTAAHCQAGSRLGQVKFVALGILRRSDPAALWQHYGVDRFIPHPQYSYPSTYHDIALIRTDREIVFGRNVLPACIAHREPFSSEIIITAGWGATGHKQGLADTLQMAKLTRYEDPECAALYPVHRRHRARGFDNETQMCYGDREGNRDTCQGDSGGPLELLWLGRVYCSDFVVGVTSNGRACGQENSAGVYTRVLHYLAWIEDTVWPNDTTTLQHD